MSIAAQTSLPNPPIAILGVPFDNLTPDETLALISRMVGSRRPHHLVTADVDFLVQSQTDVELRRILFEAHLVLCDGAPLLWASRLLGNPLPGGVAGQDIAPLLMQIAADNGYRLFLLGATPESTERAIASLRARHPQLIVAGHYSPPFKQLIEMTHDEVLRQVSAARPDILFVALGSQKQEKWIAMHLRTLGVPVCIGVGSTFDFFATRFNPPPPHGASNGSAGSSVCGNRRAFHHAAWRKIAGRSAREFFRQWWQFRSREHENWKRATSKTVRSEINWQSIRLPESLDLITARDDNMLVDQALADGRHCLLEAHEVQSIDSTGVGMLIGLQKKIRATGRQLVLLAPSQPLAQALEVMHLGNFFDSAPDLNSAQDLIALRTQERAGAVSPSDAAPSSPLLWQGEITAANCDAVWELTQIHLLKPGRRELTIDMSAVRFIDSSGAGIMLRARKFAQQHGIKLKFTNVQDDVLNVLRVSRLEEFLLR